MDNTFQAFKLRKYITWFISLGLVLGIAGFVTGTDQQKILLRFAGLIISLIGAVWLIIYEYKHKIDRKKIEEYKRQKSISKFEKYN